MTLYSYKCNCGNCICKSCKYKCKNSFSCPGTNKRRLTDDFFTLTVIYCLDYRKENK